MAIISYINKGQPPHICYANNTGADIRDHHAMLLNAINNGGKLPEEYAGIFKLTKTPAGSACDWVVDFV